MEKTIREWFEELPSDIKEKALANTPEEDLNEIRPSLSRAIAAAFSWSATPEGSGYWLDLHNECYNKEQSTLDKETQDIETLLKEIQELRRQKKEMFDLVVICSNYTEAKELFGQSNTHWTNKLKELSL